MSGQLLEAQKRLQANLDGALETCNVVLSECGSSADLPPIGTDSVCCISAPQAMLIVFAGISCLETKCIGCCPAECQLSNGRNPSINCIHSNTDWYWEPIRYQLYCCWCCRDNNVS